MDHDTANGAALVAGLIAFLPSVIALLRDSVALPDVVMPCEYSGPAIGRP
jgi:hypothetical protein